MTRASLTPEMIWEEEPPGPPAQAKGRAHATAREAAGVSAEGRQLLQEPRGEGDAKTTQTVGAMTTHEFKEQNDLVLATSVSPSVSTTDPCLD